MLKTNIILKASTLRQARLEMFEKGFVQPVFASRTSLQRPAPLANETYETEFEEDLSDYEEFSGRRSEDSVSTFDLLPNSIN